VASLLSLIVDLETRPMLAARYRSDPADVVDDYQLGDEAKELMLGGDGKRLLDALLTDLRRSARPPRQSQEMSSESNQKGSLWVVGTGIEAIGQVTPAARSCIEEADEVFYAADRFTAGWIESLNPAARSLTQYYDTEKPRIITYGEMVRAVLDPVRAGRTVCLALYGHPGIVAHPGHEAIRVARREGYEAQMLPGVSAEASLIADLNVDPGKRGWQSYAATDFLLRRPNIELSTPLILWQVSVTGIIDSRTVEEKPAGLIALTERLASLYGPDHEVILYQAALFAVDERIIRPLRVRDLTTVALPSEVTLFVPPKATAQEDHEMLKRLDLDRNELEQLYKRSRDLYSG
jgi:uncharacterized protein YabN with tetrapyrrole methylase and pyrophosphatase domain